MGLAKSKAGVPYALSLDAFIGEQTQACLDRIVAAWLRDPTKRSWAEGMAAKTGTAEGALLLTATGPWKTESDAVLAENPGRNGTRTHRALAKMDEMALKRVLSMSDERWWTAAEKVSGLYDGADLSSVELPATTSLPAGFELGPWTEQPNLPLDPSSSVPRRFWERSVKRDGLAYFYASVGDEVGMDGVNYGGFNWTVALVGSFGEPIAISDDPEGKFHGWKAATLPEARTACDSGLMELVQRASGRR